MSYHFEQLKKISFLIFKVKHTSLNGNELTLKNNDESNNKIIGKIFDLNNNNSKNNNIIEENNKINIHNNNHNENKIIEEAKLELDENKKTHLEFLYKLHQYYQELNKEINENNNSKISTEEGYIINYKLIETLKKYYYYDEIKNLFERANSINDLIRSLPKEYIAKVQKQNEDILKKKELYFPEVKKYGNLEIK